MRRRELFSMAAVGGVAGVLTAKTGLAQGLVAPATRGMPSPKIRDISVITTQPGGVRLIVVKVSTDQAGLPV